MKLSHSANALPPEGLRSLRLLASRKAGDQLSELARAIEGQEMSAFLDRGHQRTRNESSIVFTFMRSRPVLAAPDQAHGRVDASVALCGGLPGRRVAQQADKTFVMA